MKHLDCLEWRLNRFFVLAVLHFGQDGQHRLKLEVLELGAFVALALHVAVGAVVLALLVLHDGDGPRPVLRGQLLNQLLLHY